MTKRLIMGVDPGVAGGVAFVDPEARTVSAFKLPIRKRTLASGKTRSVVDAVALATLIRQHGPTEAWVEDVHAIGKQKNKERRDGVVGAFSFGQNKGTIVGVIAAVMGTEPELVDPAKWKAAMGLSSDKNLAIQRAQALFPRFRDELQKDGPAEASLLGLYGAMMRR